MYLQSSFISSKQTWNVLTRFRKVLSKNENVMMTVAHFSQQVAAEV